MIFYVNKKLFLIFIFYIKISINKLIKKSSQREIISIDPKKTQTLDSFFATTKRSGYFIVSSCKRKCPDAKRLIKLRKFTSNRGEIQILIDTKLG